MNAILLMTKAPAAGPEGANKSSARKEQVNAGGAASVAAGAFAALLGQVVAAQAQPAAATTGEPVGSGEAQAAPVPVGGPSLAAVNSGAAAVAPQTHGQTDLVFSEARNGEAAQPQGGFAAEAAPVKAVEATGAGATEAPFTVAPLRERVAGTDDPPAQALAGQGAPGRTTAGQTAIPQVAPTPQAAEAAVVAQPPQPQVVAGSPAAATPNAPRVVAGPEVPQAEGGAREPARQREGNAPNHRGDGMTQAGETRERTQAPTDRPQKGFLAALQAETQAQPGAPHPDQAAAGSRPAGPQQHVPAQGAKGVRPEPKGDAPASSDPGVQAAPGQAAPLQAAAFPRRPEVGQAAPPRETPMTVEPRDVLGQVVDRMKVSISGERTEARIHLVPEQLGPVELKVSLEGGQLTARFHVASSQVKEVLEQHLPELRQALHDQGFRVEHFTVSLGAGTMSQDPGQGRQTAVWQNQAARYGRYGRYQEEPAVSATAAAAQTARAGAGRLDLIA